MAPESDPPGSGKRYDQYCAVARALDVVGERWTLLVVRSLLIGPQRYTDLRNALPGIATDLLTARLRTLEQAGYVARRELPAPAPATVYELTASGWNLAPVVLALAKVGLQRLEPPAPGDKINSTAFTLLLRASFDPERRPDADVTYQLELDDEQFTVSVVDGRVQTARGSAPAADCTISTTTHKLAELLFGVGDPDAAVKAGEVTVGGSGSDLTEFVNSFAYPPAARG